MREVELKAVVADPEALRARLLAAGAREVYHGAMSDRRYDRPRGELLRKDHVLRLRIYEDAAGRRAVLDWKGPTDQDAGFKVREELSTPCGDGSATAEILARLGYTLIHEIDREIEQYDVRGATLRVERYPRMDVLVEVEGTPDAIEAAIEEAGMPRDAFSGERLADFVARFEARTGTPAAVSRRELDGDARYGSALR